MVEFGSRLRISPFLAVVLLLLDGNFAECSQDVLAVIIGLPQQNCYFSVWLLLFL